MILILDYGMGNSGSILNMIRKAGGDAVVSVDTDLIANASAIILPGVGSFDNGMNKLESLGLIEVLTEAVINKKIPFLGICLGMQLLFDKSDEGSLNGFGWIKGEVKKFSLSDHPHLKIPHMGWNIIKIENATSILKDLEGEARFYFVHSYYVVCKDSSDILATARYGDDFTCVVQKGNIFGAQFHAEKSHRFGLTLFKNFLEYAQC